MLRTVNVRIYVSGGDATRTRDVTRDVTRDGAPLQAAADAVAEKYEAREKMRASAQRRRRLSVVKALFEGCFVKRTLPAIDNSYKLACFPPLPPLLYPLSPPKNEHTRTSTC